MRRFIPMGWCALVASAALMAAEPVPEVQRPMGTPQAVGVVHSVRTIPEACVRFEGRFTGNPATPYAMTAVRTSARCQPRATVVDAKTAKPSIKSGWVLNDVIRIPEAACPARMAVIRIWRISTPVSAPKRDTQGRVRVYLKDSMAASTQPQHASLPRYAVQMTVQGRGHACRN